uniref:SH2 domain-containing protein n=1 Tax=Salarias fasciatus TaxID=181472 RepID=A0A672HCS4_SALFA
MNVETLSKLAAPATAKIRQLQKLVQDIKKNDGSLLNRLKRLKSKPRPNVPARDYQGKLVRASEYLFEMFFCQDNDMYECPREDDSYEPPPSHRVFPSTPFGSFPRGEYIDSCRTRPSQPPRKPARPGKQSKQLPAEPTPDGSDEEDYVDPDANTDDDNYVEPAENPPASKAQTETLLPHRARRDLPMLPPHVPERQPSPGRSRSSLTTSRSFHMMKHKLHVIRSGDSDHDFIWPLVCHTAEARWLNGPLIPLQDADIFRRPWFANTCDRKTADDALYRSNKDGAFMVRKSSGQDAQQPYTLVVFYNCRVYNIPIRFIPSTQQYALGREKKGEEFFSSVSHIIEHHQRNPLVLIDGQSNAKDATRLCYPVKP